MGRASRGRSLGVVGRTSSVCRASARGASACCASARGVGRSSHASGAPGPGAASPPWGTPAAPVGTSPGGAPSAPDAKVAELEAKCAELRRDVDSIASFARTLLVLLEDKGIATEQLFAETKRKLDAR